MTQTTGVCTESAKVLWLEKNRKLQLPWSTNIKLLLYSNHKHSQHAQHQLNCWQISNCVDNLQTEVFSNSMRMTNERKDSWCFPANSTHSKEVTVLTCGLADINLKMVSLKRTLSPAEAWKYFRNKKVHWRQHHWGGKGGKKKKIQESR